MLRRLVSSFGCCTWLPSQPCSPWMLVVLVLILLDWIPLRALLPGAGEGGTGGRGTCSFGGWHSNSRRNIHFFGIQSNERVQWSTTSSNPGVWWSVLVRSFMSRVLRSQGWWCRIFLQQNVFFCPFRFLSLDGLRLLPTFFLNILEAEKNLPWTNHCPKDVTPAPVSKTCRSSCLPGMLPMYDGQKQGDVAEDSKLARMLTMMIRFLTKHVPGRIQWWICDCEKVPQGFVCWHLLCPRSKHSSHSFP